MILYVVNSHTARRCGEVQAHYYTWANSLHRSLLHFAIIETENDVILILEYSDLAARSLHLTQCEGSR